MSELSTLRVRYLWPEGQEVTVNEPDPLPDNPLLGSFDVDEPEVFQAVLAACMNPSHPVGTMCEFLNQAPTRVVLEPL